MTIGVHVDSAVPALIDASRLNRHTFWCGQSGSGKTYALGVLLEQVLLHTRLPIVVFDPNSDFVRLGSVREGAPVAEAAELSSRNIRVLDPDPDSADPLRVRFLGIDVRSRAAIVQMDPVQNAEDFNTVLHSDEWLRSDLSRPVHERLLESDNPAFHRLATRLENLGITEWNLWAYGERAVTDIIAERADATVVDLGRFASPAQMQTTALAVLDDLWARRDEKVARLIVIDEAHNLCPPDPATPLERLLSERIVQIAAEGRKYGLWLLLSTQRPSKLHPNVISQCDNLALMKMSSPRDLAELSQIFGFAPEELLARSPGFTQGQALFAGGFSPTPQLVQMGERLTHEGGSDVRIPLR